MFGEHAVLDDPIMLDMLQPYDRLHPNATLRYLIVQMIKYPRLVALVRQLTRQTSDRLLRDEIITLAKHLYDCSMEPIDAKHQLSPYYSSHRIMLCGVIQKLRDAVNSRNK